MYFPLQIILHRHDCLVNVVDKFISIYWKLMENSKTASSFLNKQPSTRYKKLCSPLWRDISILRVMTSFKGIFTPRQNEGYCHLLKNVYLFIYFIFQQLHCRGVAPFLQRLWLNVLTLLSTWLKTMRYHGDVIIPQRV